MNLNEVLDIIWKIALIAWTISNIADIYKRNKK
jgi:hypothetical protein